MLKKTVLRFAGVSLIALLAGCSSMSGMKSDSAMTPAKTVVTSTHGNQTVVYVPSPDGVKTYAPAGVDVCAQCKADVMAFSKGNKLAPVCSACGANRTTMMVQN